MYACMYGRKEGKEGGREGEGRKGREGGGKEGREREDWRLLCKVGEEGDELI